MARLREPRWLQILGPGLVTGAADDDPSGIATYSQAGAAFGYGQLWTLTLCLPLMIAVQEATGRIGASTGKGLARVTRETYSRRVLYLIVGLVVVANVINIAADIAAVGSALNLLIAAPPMLLAVVFTLVLLALEIGVQYHQYVRFLKVLAVALLAYVATALFVAEPWGTILASTVIPQFRWTSAFWYVIVGILGTTISPYMFFWQASQEVEERELADGHHTPRRNLRTIRQDTTVGMFISQIGSWFMMLTTATVLHANGIVNVGTAADAAKALEPLVHSFPHAGTWAKAIFAVGIVGMGMLGIPVLAGSASYAVSEVFGWTEGLEHRPRDAKKFYAVLAAATLVGLLLNALGVNPISALIFAAVVNGVASVPLVLLITRISTNPSIMGEAVGGRWSKRLLYVTFAIMLTCAGILFASLIHW